VQTNIYLVRPLVMETIRCTYSLDAKPKYLVQVDVDVIVRIPSSTRTTDGACQRCRHRGRRRSSGREDAAQKTLDRPRAGSMIAAGASETPLAGLPLHGGQHGRLGSEDGAALWYRRKKMELRVISISPMPCLYRDLSGTSPTEQRSNGTSPA
jgi:hypothetical protein